MIKHVLNQFNAAIFAEISLLIFAAVFVAVVIRTLMTKSETANHHANVVLDDLEEKYK